MNITIQDNQSLDGYQQLKDYYKVFLNNNLTNAKELITNLEVVNKFSESPTIDLKQFKAGQWLQQLADFNCDIKDPVLLASPDFRRFY